MVAHDLRLVEIPSDHRLIVAEVVENKGMPEAMRLLGLGRTAILGIIARGRGMPGTAALLREYLAGRKQAA